MLSCEVENLKCFPCFHSSILPNDTSFSALNPHLPLPTHLSKPDGLVLPGPAVPGYAPEFRATVCRPVSAHRASGGLSSSEPRPTDWEVSRGEFGNG